jgi:uncharacterized protein
MRNKITAIQNAYALQNIIGEPHDIIKAKVLRQLDRHCLFYLKQSPVAFLGFRHEGLSEILILNGDMGFIKAVNHVTLHIPYHQEFSVIDSKVFDKPLPVSLYFWVPGIEDTLRINGVVSRISDNINPADNTPIASSQDFLLNIEGAFLHCAKSIKRSGLWVAKKHPDRKINFENSSSELISDNHRLFIELSPFLCLHTQDNSKRTELSPRGDPPGSVQVIDDRHLLIPDRPGNKRVDSMHNLLNDPRLGIIFLIPGSDLVLKVNGKASLVNDPELLQLLAIENKAPKLALLVTTVHCQFYRAKSLNWRQLWTQATMVDRKQFPALGQILAEQAAGNQSLITKLKGKLVEAVIKLDYKKNLY